MVSVGEELSIECCGLRVCLDSQSVGCRVVSGGDKIALSCVCSLFLQSVKVDATLLDVACSVKFVGEYSANFAWCVANAQYLVIAAIEHSSLREVPTLCPFWLVLRNFAASVCGTPRTQLRKD